MKDVETQRTASHAVSFILCLYVFFSPCLRASVINKESTMERDENEFSFRQFLIRHARENPPSMIYKNGDFRSWQERFFSKLVELRGDVPPRVPMKPEVAERVQEKDHIRERIYFHSTEGVRVSSYMLIPNDLLCAIFP